MAVVVAAGQWVEAAVLLTSATALLRWATSVVSISVVNVIQLGAGLSLGISWIVSPSTSWLGLSGTGQSHLGSIRIPRAGCDTHLQRFPYALVFFDLIP
ncbi:hypothetical protein E4U12_004558, partial [Claviceps purpurea]